MVESDGELAESIGPKMSLDDAYYIIFRHKWMVLTCALVGLIVAGCLYRLAPRQYRSDAKVMVKYVPERESAGLDDGLRQGNSVILRGDSVVSAEAELLASTEVATKVAASLGPERILAKTGGGTNLELAAAAIRGGLKCYAPERGNVLTVVFQHEDASLVQPVLDRVIDEYFVHHYNLHRGIPNLAEFKQQREELKAELRDTESKLWDLQTNNGVFSIEEAKKSASQDLERTRVALNEAETDLAQKKAALQFFEKFNKTSSKTGLDAEPDNMDQLETAGAKYTQVMVQLEQLRKKQSEYLPQFRPGSAMLNSIETDIERLEAERKGMEKQHPELVKLGVAISGNRSVNAFTVRQDVELIQAKIGTLTNRLAEARAEEVRLHQLDRTVQELQRKKELLDSKFRHYSRQIDTAQFDAALGASRDSNLSKVSSPSRPRLDIGPLYKRMGLAVLGGIGFGLGLAALLEMFLDQRVKRPVDLQRLLSIPLLLSIPAIEKRQEKRLAKKAGLAGSLGTSSSGTLALAHNRLQAYFETLRDLVLNRFDALARKPKLVGVCGCGDASAASTAAAGLATALAEAGDLKVLLVDMKLGNGGAHAFNQGRKSCSLLDALEGDTRQEALVAPNLYAASAQGADNQQSSTSVRRFGTVVPRLNASDYDYIIFDMPLVDEISATPRLAKHMDLTLLVVEAEKARRKAVQLAGSLLLEFTPNVAMVLNNTRNFLPRMLQ